ARSSPRIQGRGEPAVVANGHPNTHFFPCPSCRVSRFTACPGRATEGDGSSTSIVSRSSGLAARPVVYSVVRSGPTPGSRQLNGFDSHEGRGSSARPHSRTGTFRLPVCLFGELLMNEVTRILSAIEQGDPSSAEQLLPLVYDELRRLAA